MSDIKSLYVELPPDEARKRWDAAGPQLKRLLLSLPQDEVSLHFIPAIGGCVIAAVPGSRKASRKLRLRSPVPIPQLRSTKSSLDELIENLRTALSQDEPQPLALETASTLS